MGNTEYLCAWSEVVLPVVHDFKPDLIIVSSGFDAAKGDLIGDCLLTPECYYLMTKR
jgi:histone deacetylase 6